MKKLPYVICGKYRKFEKPKISLSLKTLIVLKKISSFYYLQ